MVINCNQFTVNLLNKSIEANGAGYCIERFALSKFNDKDYEWFVERIDLFGPEPSVNSKGEFQAIKVIYKADQYAAPVYLSKGDLLKAARNGGMTVNGYIKEVFNEVMI